MFTQVYPVPGQTVKPALGVALNGNFWLFLEQATRLPAWLVLHRESVNDAELDAVLASRFTGIGTGHSLDYDVLTHFGLANRQTYRADWMASQHGRMGRAVFTSQLQVVKLPLTREVTEGLRNPASLYWASAQSLMAHTEGSAEFERGHALVEMASILMARWGQQRLQHLDFDSRSRIGQLLQEAGALAEGAYNAAASFLGGLWDIVRATLTFAGQAFKVAVNGLEMAVRGQFKAIQQALLKAGMGVYHTAEEVIAAVKEGTRLLTLIGSDSTLRQALWEFLDGYTESSAHLNRLKAGAQAVVEIGIEVLLALATAGATLVVAGARLAARVGPFTARLIRHMARFARALEQRIAEAARRLPEPKKAPTSPSNARKAAGDKAPEPSATRNTPSSTESKGRSGPAARDNTTGGEPVSLINGEELLQFEDFRIKGLIDLPFVRSYASKAAEEGMGSDLGAGWFHPLSTHLRIQAHGLSLIDGEGRSIDFTPLQVGQRCVHTVEQTILQRTGPTTYTLRPRHGLGLIWHFSALAQSPAARGTTLALLEAIEHPSGHRLCVDYAPAQGGAVPTLNRVRNGSYIYQFEHGDDGLLKRVVQLARHNADEQLALAPVQSRSLATYTHSTDGDLASAADPCGHAEHYRYTDHRLAQRTLKSGYTIHFEWAQLPGEFHHRCTRQWGDPVDGQATYLYRFEWARPDGSHAVIDSRGACNAWRFNELGLPVWQSDPLGHVTTHRYNALGQRIQTTAPTGAQWHWEWTDQGQLAQATDPLGHATRWTYDARGQCTAVTDPEGHTHRFQYDEQGHMVRHTNPLGHVRTLQYNAHGQVASVLDPTGRRTRQLTDADGALLAVEGPGGARQVAHYDVWGQLASVTDPLGQTTRYGYDLAGRCTAITNAQGQTTRYEYAPLGVLSSVTDAQGQVTQYEYAHGLSQPTARINPLGQRRLYGYDTERNLVWLTNENGDTARFTYDLNERLIREEGFDGRLQTYSHNPMGYVLARHDYGTPLAHRHGSGPLQWPDQPLVTTHMQRDALGRLHRQQAGQDWAEYHYTPLGHLHTASNAHSELHWAYNALGQPIDEWITLRGPSPQGLANAQYHLHRDYDAAGAPVRLHAQGPGLDEVHELELSATGQVSQVLRNQQLIAQFEHDPAGREVRSLLGNGLETLLQHDPQGRLIAQRTQHVQHKHGLGIGNTAEFSRRYHYNTVGQLVRLDDSLHGTSQFHYDPTHRLTHIQGPTPEAFLFDPASNLLEALSGPDAEQALDRGSLPPPASPNARRPMQSPGNRLLNQQGQHYRYNALGQRVQVQSGKKRTDLHYNAQAQLVSLKVCVEGQPQQNTAALYRYDPLGRRIGKVVCECLAGAESVQETRFIWNGDVLLAEQQATHTTSYLFKPGTFTPLAQVVDGQVEHIHTDHLGTPRELTNAQGQLVWQARFKAYGNLAVQPVGLSTCRLRFAGQYWDEESGLHYNRHRYYDPDCGQFVSQDPIGLAGGLNLYQYVPNPMTWVDPWGLSCKEYHFNMVERPGPLADMPGTPAANFAGGKYNQRVLTEDTIFYRGGQSGGGKNALGQWFNTAPPESVAKVRIDNAVKPQWIDVNSLQLSARSPVDSVYAIQIPKGTTIFEGPVGYQSGPYLGGQNMMQTFISEPWKIEGVKVISEAPLR